MTRHSHHLKSVKGGTLPTSIVCVATANQQDGTTWWGWRAWYSDSDEFGDDSPRRGKGSESFWSALRGHCRMFPGSWVMFMHATNELTRLGFWELLEDSQLRIAGHDEKTPNQGEKDWHGQPVGLCVIENPPTIIQASGKGGVFVVSFVDAANYGVSGWDSLHAGELPQSNAEAEAAAKALMLCRFVESLTECVRTNRLGSLKFTAASQAMHAFRHRFLKSPVLVHDNWPAIGLERSAVFAGRNECWTVGKAPGMVYHLDFNSFYPSVTVETMMPARLAGYRMDCKRNPVALEREGYLSIAEVTLETTEPRFPVRFSRTRHARANLSSDGHTTGLLARDGDCMYPVGTFATALCGPELSLAYATGSVRRIHSVSWYEPSELFTQWSCELAIVEELARKLATKALREFVKRLRNSLFGKFAQRHWQWVPASNIATKRAFDSWYEQDEVTGEMVRHRSIGWNVQRERMNGESPESCPAITAWIYSLARVKLWQAIECAGRCNVHYMDADSLWVTHDGYKLLELDGWLHPTLPGKLKVAGVHESVVFHGLKHYTVDGKQTHCGVPATAPGNHQQGWEFESQETVKQALCLKRGPEPRTVRHSVRPSGAYRHGIVTVGGRVIPHTFNENS